jgi:hypothetical protein
VATLVARPFGGNKTRNLCEKCFKQFKKLNELVLDETRQGETKQFASNAKDTNPKDAVGITKTPFSTIPMPVLAEVGVAMAEGAFKYGRHNYRTAGVRASVYFDATMRHLAAWWEGEDIDPDSGVSHVTKAIASLMVMRDSARRGNWNDDRPPKVNDEFLKELNGVTKKLIEKYPEPVKPHTQQDGAK